MRIELAKNMTNVRLAALLRLEAGFATRHYAVLGGAIHEVHALKADEARRVLDGGTSPLLAPEASARGISEADLAHAVLDKAQVQAEQLAQVEIDRQRAQADLKIAATPAAVEAVLAAYGIQPS
ncbi:hypothetical protein [Tianweitania sediminis]|uniref:Uncharacterized protein n=1 Tax=Tianweitania sediminis TaxID=1502156 RepID=A0A8J7UKI6_9HYPH|nr:hypothetical protein [Tianweitania sediminis]MBP0438412.1 hypothetical protein [Tianweitania sediminis]